MTLALFSGRQSVILATGQSTRETEEKRRQYDGARKEKC